MSSDESFFPEGKDPNRGRDTLDKQGLTPEPSGDRAADWPYAPGSETAISPLPLSCDPNLAARFGITFTPRPPHPSFGWSVLWCLFFLIMTQVFPVIIVAVVIVIYVAVRTGLQTPDVMQRIQDLAVMPSVGVAQFSGIVFSLVVLRLVAGPNWVRQVGLRLPRVWQVVVVVLGFPAMSVLASGAYFLAKKSIPGLEELPAFLLAQLIVIPLAWLVVRLVAGKGWSERLARHSPFFQLALVSGGVAVVVVAIGAVYWLISPFIFTLPFKGEDLMKTMVQLFRTWPGWIAVLLIGLGPGLSEELWCRGFLGRGLVGHYGVVLGVVLTSYLFGLIHLEPHQGTMAVLMGLILHFAYLMTRSLVVPMLLHFLNNSLSVLGEKLSPETGKIDAEPEKIPVLLYVAAGLLLVAAGWSLYRGRARLVSTEEGESPWQPLHPGVACPPPDSKTTVICPWPGWLATAALIIAAAVFGVVFYLMETGRLSG